MSERVVKTYAVRVTVDADEGLEYDIPRALRGELEGEVIAWDAPLATSIRTVQVVDVDVVEISDRYGNWEVLP